MSKNIASTRSIDPALPSFCSMGSMPQFFFLIGFMGAGKTTLGRLLAQKLRVPFIDLDDIFERQNCTSITAFWHQHGENAFRKEEKRLLLDLLPTLQQTTIIATGGGLPCFESNMAFLQSCGTTIYLRCSATTLAARLSDRRTLANRPLLNTAIDAFKTDMQTYDLQAEMKHHKISQLLAKRQHYYEMAHFIVDTDGLSIGQAIDCLLSLPVFYLLGR